MLRTILRPFVAMAFLMCSLGGRLVAGERGALNTATAAAADQATTEWPINRLHAWCRAPAAWFRAPEAVEMLSVIARGSQMGPGDGWFHPGKSRYGWNWLASHFDANADGAVSEEELSAPGELFERLDRNGDGELKADDFDWSEQSPFVRQQGQAGQWFSRIDKSSNGRITPEEWDQFFERLAGEKGYVSSDDLRAALLPPAQKRAAKPAGSQDGPPKEVFIRGLISGELGSIWEGPDIDQRAPDFELETQNGSNQMRLSSFRHQKPVVLVFGSFT